MKKAMLLIFVMLIPNLLSAQSDIEGNWWRFQVDNTPLAISEESPDIQAPKCLVEGETQQCILRFAGLVFNRDFVGGGNNADRLWLPKFQLVVEPFNPIYENGESVLEIGLIINMPVLYITTDIGIIALCNVSLVKQQTSEFYIPAGFEPCGDDIMVPVIEQVGPPPSALTDPL